MDLANFERRANSGAPVVGARVTLYAATAIDPTTPVATTFTDANGYWAFTGLAQGAYDLLVEAPGSGYKKWYKGQAKIGVDQLAVSSGFSPASGTVPGASLVTGSVTTTQIADNTILNIDVNPAAGIAITKLADLGANNVLRSDGAGNLAGKVQTNDLAALAVTQIAATAVIPSTTWGNFAQPALVAGSTIPFTVPYANCPVAVLFMMSVTMTAGAPGNFVSATTGMDGTAVATATAPMAYAHPFAVNSYVPLAACHVYPALASGVHTAGLYVNATGGSVSLFTGQLMVLLLKR